MEDIDLAMAEIGRPTGRMLVCFHVDAMEDGGAMAMRAMSDMGLRMARASDFPEGPIPEAVWTDGDGCLFDHIGVACLSATSTSGAPVRDLMSSMDMAEHIEDEMIRHALGAPVPAPPAPAETGFAWGLQATGVANSPYSGKGVKVAVLDTGIDLTHPDFKGRPIVTASFIAGETVQDAHGHGTHTAGIACGPREPAMPPRYGVAPDAELHVGKVLGDRGQGPDAGILAGINWALRSGCRVISMSLGAIAPASMAYEQVGQMAMMQNALIIAAAGNESRRAQGFIAPVDSPASCASVLSVAAVDAASNVAFFSCAGNAEAPAGAQVDIAAPGVDILSAYRGGAYRRMQGTSMATPLVAGIAALYIEANPRAGAADIWRMLVQSAQRLPLSAMDVGAGLARAPTAPRSLRKRV